jgi:hypothetical protein
MSRRAERLRRTRRLLYRYQLGLILKRRSTPGGGHLNKDITLDERTWTYLDRAVVHDRDVNAAINLQELATPTAYRGDVNG